MNRLHTFLPVIWLVSICNSPGRSIANPMNTVPALLLWRLRCTIT